MTFSEDEIDALQRIAATKPLARHPEQPLTLWDAVRTMAKLGGSAESTTASRPSKRYGGVTGNCS